MITNKHRLPSPISVPYDFTRKKKSNTINNMHRSVLFMHNHPSGDPKPSRDDIEMTKEIRKATEALGIAIHDHLVIGRKDHASFRSLGLLT